MKDWKYHYEQAETWLEKAHDPNMGYRAEQMIARAQVHATLAEIGMDEDQELNLPPSLDDDLPEPGSSGWKSSWVTPGFHWGTKSNITSTVISDPNKPGGTD